jgi:hypothetical protein
MYLHIGSDILLPFTELIVIIGFKGKKDSNKVNQKFLERVKDMGFLNDLANGNEKSLIVTTNDQVYISQITTHTLTKRSKNFGLPGGTKKIDG